MGFISNQRGNMKTRKTIAGKYGDFFWVNTSTKHTIHSRTSTAAFFFPSLSDSCVSKGCSNKKTYFPMDNGPPSREPLHRYDSTVLSRSDGPIRPYPHESDPCINDTFKWIHLFVIGLKSVRTLRRLIDWLTTLSVPQQPLFLIFTELFWTVWYLVEW